MWFSIIFDGVKIFSINDPILMDINLLMSIKKKIISLFFLSFKMIQGKAVLLILKFIFLKIFKDMLSNPKVSLEKFTFS